MVLDPRRDCQYSSKSPLARNARRRSTASATICREGRQYMEMAPHLALWPGVCLTVVVYSLNMFGDAVRDLLDPRLRGRLGRYGAARK